MVLIAVAVELDKRIPLVTRVTTSASPLVVNNGTIGRLVVCGDDIADLATAAAAASTASTPVTYDLPLHHITDLLP